VHTDTAEQFSAVYAEAAIAFLETQVPQAVLWYEDEERWDFTPADEDLRGSEVAFVLQKGWDGQLSLEATTDIDDEEYDSRALRDEIEQQMIDEGVAKALIESLAERREALDDEDNENENDEEMDDDEGDR